MNPELARTVERLGQRRAARDARESDQWPVAAHGTASTNRALEAGARVFDRVTGQEGTIVGRTRQDFIVQPADERNR